MLSISRNVIGLIIVCVVIQGCTGKIVTKNLTLEEIDQDGKEFKGMVYYPPALFKEESKTTIRIEGGNVVGSASGHVGAKCEPIPQIKYVVYADYTHPKLVSYDHGILEAYEFNVTYNGNGTLGAVSNTSTPDRGETLKNLTEAATNVASIAAFAGAKKPCNEGSIVIGLSRVKDE